MMDINKEKSLIGKFMEYAIGSALTLILGFFSTPIITRLINPNDFGKFSMFNLFIGISVIILTLGFEQSFVRFYHEEDDKILLLRKTIKIPMIFCIVYTFIILIFKNELNSYIFQENNIEAIIITILNCYIMLVNRYSLLVVRMNQNGKLYSTLQVIQKAIYIVFALGLAMILDRNYILLIRATLVSNISVTLISMIAYKEFWFCRITSKSQLKISQKDIFMYGFPIMTNLIISWIFQSADKMCIKEFNDYSQVGIYAAAFSIISLLNQIQTTFISFWTPVAYEHFNEKNNDRDFYAHVFDIVAFSMLSITIFLIVFKDIIVLLLGDQFREASFVMPFLIFMPLMNTVSEVTVIGINFMKKTKYHVFITFICSIFNIIGNVFLVPIIGARGAAISTGVTYIIFFVLRTIISNKLYKINFKVKKFYILFVLTLMLTTYSTFKNVDIVTILISIVIVVLMVFFYRNILLDIFKLVKTNCMRFKGDKCAKSN